MSLNIPPTYRPSEAEPFMNPRMREYFCQKLLRWREEILREADETRRIADGTYGYCEETDEPIELNRLEARPIAALSIDAQARHEREERSGAVARTAAGCPSPASPGAAAARR